MTNGERIRNMDDSKLAEFLTRIQEPDEDTLLIEGREFFSEKEIQEWLNEESVI